MSGSELTQRLYNMLTRAAQRAAIAAINRNTRTRAASVVTSSSVKEESGGLVERFSFQQTVKAEEQVEKVPPQARKKERARGARRRSTSKVATLPEADNEKKRVKVEKKKSGSGKHEKNRRPAQVKAELQVPPPPSPARAGGRTAGAKRAAPTAAPKDFESVYRIIEELRHPDGLDQPMRGAPVDEIGCSQAADAVFRADGEERNFHVRWCLGLEGGTR